MSTYMVTTKGINLGDANENVYYFYHAAMTTEILTATWQYLMEMMAEHLAPQLCDSYTCDRVAVRRVDAAGYPSVEYTPDIVVEGERTEDPEPSQATCNVELYTNTQAPNHGRKYIGGFSEPGLDGDGLWTSTVTTAVISFLTPLMNMIATPETYAEWVIARWNVGHTNIVAHNPVVSGSVSLRPGTLRSRRLGVGR